ncbi:MAG: hypothetical protein RLY31_1273 [Bacteroidota bacterium]|jgi:purine-nucleoside phosphorylase
MSYEQIAEAAAFIREQTGFLAETGVILGTGLGSLAQEIETEAEIEYGIIPHFPTSTVESHAGRLLFGRLSGRPVIAMDGRLHYYEGYSMQQVTFPVRVLWALGVRTLLLSNAAGSTNPEIEAGDLVFIRDHINLHPAHPLRGPNDERLGIRFPDMLETYDRELLDAAAGIARAAGIRAHTGVYVGLQGPNLETPAEYEFLHRIGGDVVGMSTIPEVIVARHAGMRVFVVSVVSNKSYPVGQIVRTTLADVLAVVRTAEPRLAQVVRSLLVHPSMPDSS